MPSLVAPDKIAANNKIAMYDHDPDATTAVIVSGDGGTTKRYVDGRDAEYFGVVAMTTVGEIAKLEIVAATDAAFTSPVVVKDSGAVAADAVGDYVVQECTMAEVAHLGSGLRYLAGRITMTTATDEAAVTYIQTGLRHAATGSTANAIA